MSNRTGLRLVSDGDGGYSLVRVAEDQRQRFNSPVGTGMRMKYIAMYDNGHNRRFYREKEFDQYARIQSYKDSCLLSNIIARFTNGDVSALSKVQGAYVDTTLFPGDTRSSLDLINRTRGVFDGLSKEEKARYHNDFGNFIGSFGNSAGIDAFIQSRMKEAAPVASAAPSSESTGGVNNES